MNTETKLPGKRRPKSNVNWVLIGLIAIIGYFLFMEHKAHILSFFPYALLLGCIVMHLFMHHGHGSGHKGVNGDDPPKGDER